MAIICRQVHFVLKKISSSNFAVFIRMNLLVKIFLEQCLKTPYQALGGASNRIKYATETILINNDSKKGREKYIESEVIFPK